MISYYDATNLDLKVLHCGDPDCTGEAKIGGVVELPDVDGASLETDRRQHLRGYAWRE